MRLLNLASLLLIPIASAEIFFMETFDDDSWKSRWVPSKWKKAYGSWTVKNGKFFGDAIGSRGLATVEDNRFFAISSKLSDDYDSKDKDLIIQFSVKHDQKIDCGGGYIKLLPPGLVQEDFNDESPYTIMFGPDICGGTGKTHAILNYKGKNNLIKKKLPVELDELTHVYTLELKPDFSWRFILDGKVKDYGNILDDWDLLPPRQIADPSVKKPKDWVDEEMITDPNHESSESELISDPEASKPSDWDDEADGEWVAPKIKNPKYTEPPKIKNPKYKGEWVAPKIDNPAFVMDPEVNHWTVGFVGIDLWQVKAGSIFDDILLTDSYEEAKDYYDQVLVPKLEKEKEAKVKFDKEEDRHKPPPPVFKLGKDGDEAGDSASKIAEHFNLNKDSKDKKPAKDDL